MKKNLFFILLATLLTACNLSTTIVVTPGKKELPKEGGTFTLTVTTAEDDNAWTAECDSAWVHLSKTEGIGDDKVEVTVDANPYAELQSTIIRFRDADNLVQVIVMREGTGEKSADDKPVQNQNAPVKVDKSEIKATAEGGTFEIAATAASDVQYTISSSIAWVTLDKGMARGNTNFTITVLPTPEEVYTESKALVTIKPIKAESDADYTYIYITRDGRVEE